MALHFPVCAEITAIVRSYGGLCFWDYAAAAPYVDIDMNPYISGQSDLPELKDKRLFARYCVGLPRGSHLFCAA